MNFEMKIQGIDGLLDTLHDLPPEVVSRRGGPVKAALAKGARLLRDEAKLNLQRSINERGADSTGTTLASVIASRGKAPNDGKGERYLVRVKKRTFINAKGRKTSTLMTANLLEWGSKHQAPTPWLRPTVARRGVQVVTVVTEDLIARVDRLVKKMAQQNGSR